MEYSTLLHLLLITISVKCQDPKNSAASYVKIYTSDG